MLRMGLLSAEEGISSVQRRWLAGVGDGVGSVLRIWYASAGEGSFYL